MAKKTFNIRYKLLVIFLSVSLVPIALMGFVATQKGQKLLKESLGLSLREDASHLIETIDRELFIWTLHIKTWSTLSVMQDVLADDPDGRIAELLVNSKREYGINTEILCTNNKGKVIAATKPEVINQDASEEEWFIKMRQKPELQSGGYHFDSLLKREAIEYAYPIFAIFDPTQVIGYLSLHVYFDEFHKMIDSAMVSDKEQNRFNYILMINNKGEVIAAPRFLREEKGEALFRENLASLGYKSAREVIAGKEGYLIEKNNSLKGRWLTGYANSKGYQNFKGFGWAILVMRNTEEAFAPLDNLRNQFIGITLSVACFVLFLAFFISYGITKSIRKLIFISRAIARGDLSQTIEIHTNDEIEELAEAFNSMNSDLKMSTDQLKAARDYTEKILKRMIDTLIVVDRQEKIKTINPAALDLLGYTEEELLGQSLAILIGPEQNLSNMILEKGIIRNQEVSCKKKDGTPVPMLFSGSVMVDENDQSEGVIFIAKDMTEIQRIQKTLDRLQSQNKLILEAAGYGILGLDLEGGHTFVNPAAAKMLGYEAGELIGKPSHALWHHTRADGTPYPREECHIYAAYKKGVVTHSDTEVFWKKDGTSFPVEYTSTPIQEGGKVTGAVVTFSDITTRRKMETELKSKLEDLKQFREVTIDRENKMIELKKEINKLSEELGRPAPHDLSFLKS